MNGGWGPWQLRKCNVTCGNGTMIRTRLCNNPQPSNGGRGCVGRSREVKACKESCFKGTS